MNLVTEISIGFFIIYKFRLNRKTAFVYSPPLRVKIPRHFLQIKYKQGYIAQ